MDEFNWDEIDAVLKEQSELEQKMFQFNGITESLQNGLMNRELATLASELDSDWFSLEQYPLGSFTADYSMVNHEVVMKGWFDIALKLSNQLSGVSLRVAIMVAGAVIWLISRIRKKLKGDDSGTDNNGKGGSGGSGGGGSSSGGGSRDYDKDVQNIIDQYNAVMALANSDPRLERKLKKGLDDLNTSSTVASRNLSNVVVDWHQVLIDLAKLLNSAKNIIYCTNMQSETIEKLYSDTSSYVSYKLHGRSGKRQLSLADHAVIPPMVKSFKRSVRDFYLDEDKNDLSTHHGKLVLNNLLKDGAPIARALSSAHYGDHSLVTKANRGVCLHRVPDPLINLDNNSKVKDVLYGFSDIVSGKFISRGNHITDTLRDRPVVDFDWVKNAQPLTHTSDTKLDKAITGRAFLSAYKALEGSKKVLDKLEREAEDLNKEAGEALRKLTSEKDGLYEYPVLTKVNPTGGNDGAYVISIKDKTLENICSDSGASVKDFDQGRSVKLKLDPVLPAFVKYAIHNKKGLLNFSSNLCLNRVTRVCKIISNDITYAEVLTRELAKLKSTT